MPDTFQTFIVKHWPWIVAFIVSVSLLEYQVRDLRADVDTVSGIVAKDHEALGKLRSDHDHFVETATKGFSGLNDSARKNEATLGTIRDHILTGGRLPIDTQPLMPRERGLAR